jgi:hypothetical protein
MNHIGVKAPGQPLVYLSFRHSVLFAPLTGCSGGPAITIRLTYTATNGQTYIQWPFEEKLLRGKCRLVSKDELPTCAGDHMQDRLNEYGTRESSPKDLCS